MDSKQKKALDAVLEAANAVMEAAQAEFPEYTFVLVALDPKEKHVALTSSHKTAFSSLDTEGQVEMHRDMLFASEAVNESLDAMEAALPSIPCSCGKCGPEPVKPSRTVSFAPNETKRRPAVRIKVDGDSPGEIIDDVVIDDSFVQSRPPGRLKN
jgi:hypothetical protein